MTNRHLVVLDDEQGFCEFVKRVASQAGFDVFTTCQPSEVIPHLDEHPAEVIVLDLNMPGEDGIEMLREFASAHIAAQILLASGEDNRVIDTTLRLGNERGLRMAGIIHKPIRVAELRQILEKLKPAEDAITPQQLETAIPNNELILNYQPQLDLNHNRIIGVEALVRWQHPQFGLLMPGVFIPMAEQAGIIGSLTEWVANTAIAQAGAWRSEGLDLEVSINVSAANVDDYQLPDRLQQHCLTAGVNPSKITIELTETATMRDAAKIMDVLTRFRLKGFELSIDDFGTGYSSLVQLQQIPFSHMKIDKSFVVSMLESSGNAVIVDTIIGMSRNLGLTSVAEGVETQEVLEALRTKGCDRAQGFHIARPLPADRIGDIMRPTAPTIMIH